MVLAARESFLPEGWVFRHSSSSLSPGRLLLFYLCQANVGDGFQENGKAERGVSLKNHFLQKWVIIGSEFGEDVLFKD